MRLKKTEANAGLSSLLESAGFDPPDVRRYMELSARSGTEAARARILRGQRGRLMDTGRLSVRKEVEHWLGDMTELQIFACHNLVDNSLPLVESGFADAIAIEGAVCHYDPARFAFRPLDPPLTSTAVLAWKRFQPAFGAAGRSLDCLREKYARKE